MIEELKTFMAVVEYKNFTKAAVAINLSQPSVSLHIKQLESYFGVTLVERSIKQKKISITNAGYLLYKRAGEIINILEQTKNELTNYEETLSGNLRIGASFTIGEYILPSFLGRFSKEFPDLNLEVKIGNTASVCDMIKNKELDIGLIEGVVPSSHFKYEYFLRDEMVIALYNNHPLVGKPLSIEKLQNQTWISREDGSGTQEYLMMFLAANNIVPKNIVVFGSNYAVKEAVINELGITIISSHVTNKDVKNGEISTIPLGEKYIRYFSYILPMESTPSKAIRIFTDKIKNIG
ncbi:LysR family transcriptional regulator [Clostridium sp.]|uniref:LysR family transcriptional regulator n=1 Tax=Clostridium sp. TaxID=1506 RepID=UPI002FC88D5D